MMKTTLKNAIMHYSLVVIWNTALIAFGVLCAIIINNVRTIEGVILSVFLAGMLVVLFRYSKRLHAQQVVLNKLHDEISRRIDANAELLVKMDKHRDDCEKLRDEAWNYYINALGEYGVRVFDIDGSGSSGQNTIN